MDGIDRFKDEVITPRIEINVEFKILPTGNYSFAETVFIGEQTGDIFIPREDELEFSFPRNSETTRLFYKDFTSI